MTYSEQNLDEVRLEVMRKMKADVRRAYINRVKVSFVATPDSSDLSLEESESQKSGLDSLTDDQVIIVAPYIEQPYQATVTNSHDYKDLLYESLLLLSADNYFVSGNIRQTVQDILEHEYAHHVPALGFEAVEVRYGVSFFEDSNHNRRVVQPFIYISGQMQVIQFKTIVGAAISKSPNDEIVLS